MLFGILLRLVGERVWMEEKKKINTDKRDIHLRGVMTPGN